MRDLRVSAWSHLSRLASRFGPAAALAYVVVLPQPSFAANPMWHADGTRLVDGAARPVRISGFNTGNWLMWEGWMFGGMLIDGETAMLERIAKTLGARRRL